MSRILGLLSCVAVVAASNLTASSYMDCGSGVDVCGVLVLISGLAQSGEYHQDKPGVHGIWPETGSYGTSQCVAPQDTADPTKVYSCYQNDGSDLLGFEVHEWEKHGVCAGVQDADNFFTQMCTLANPAISIMASSKSSGGDLNAMSTALSQAGYPVFSLDTSNQQIYLSACATSSGKWKLSSVSGFGQVCGGGQPGPSPQPPSPAPGPSPTGNCPKTCSGKTCDEWYAYNGYTCAYEEEHYGCDCSGCECPGGSIFMM